jgi:hypothetical protein
MDELLVNDIRFRWERSGAVLRYFDRQIQYTIYLFVENFGVFIY